VGLEALDLKNDDDEDRSGGELLGERGGGVAPEDRARQLLCTCTAVPGTP
jgi:hypothetical protein